MKIFKKLFVLFLATSMFNACVEEEVSYALQDISAPSNLSAVFDIAQDESGMVSVTPTAIGASAFQVYFGDVDGEEATVISAGETITHTYGEGEFTLRIVAVGVSGSTSELSRIITISFEAPTELSADVEISSDNPFQLEVTPTATGATVYDVYFGDVEDETPTTIMDGETATHLYAETGEYTVRVVARGAGAATIEITETVTISGNSEPIVLPITFDDATVNYAFGTFNGATYEVVTNPDLTGTNTVESNVGAITNSGAQFEGGAFTLGTPVDFSGADKTITMKFWSSSVVPVLLKFEGGVNGDERQTEVVANHGGTGWEELTFNFATDAIKSYIDGNQGVGEAFVPVGSYATIVLFVDGPGTTAGVFYIDDIAMVVSESTLPQFPLDFESDTIEYSWLGFGAADFTEIPSGVIANPDASGINTTDNVTYITKPTGAQTWAGAGMPLDGAIDFSSSSIVTLKVWSPRVGTPILFKIEDTNSAPDANGNPSVFVEISASTTTASAWELLTYDLSTIDTFSASIIYNKVVLFPDFGTAGADETFYFDDLVIGDGSGATDGKTVFPVDFESATGGAASTWSVFENTDNPALEIITNPDMSGVNTSNTVAKFTARVDGNPWAGTETPLANPFTLGATNSIVKISVWKSEISDVGIKFANAAGGSTGEIKVPNTKVNEWEELSFDFSGVIGDPNNTDIVFLVVFPDFNARTQENVVYFDNITIGSGSTGAATEPTMAAPTPMESTANVISMFSDVYTDVTVDTWRTDWSDATLEDVMVSGNGVKKYSALSFVGIETVSATIDASSMTNFRTDIWTADATEFKIKLVDFGPDGAFDGGDDTEHEITIASPAQGEWVSLDIPLSDFTGLTTTSNIAQLIYVGSPSQANTVFVDNVYFYTDGTSTATEPTMAAPTPMESTANVISMFSDAYTDVTVDTWRTDWSDATLEDVMVSGNGVKKYSALSFVGIETVSATIDASSMTNFRTDIWTADATEFKIKLVDFGSDGAYDGGDDTEHEITISSPAQGEWVSLDIPLSDFTGLTTTSNIAQLIYVGSPSQANTVFVDNVYFYTSGTSTATEPTTAAPTPTDSAANVISLFSDAYTDVTVDTWRTDWSDATLEDVTVAGNAVKKYSALSFVGIETVSSTIDATSMTHFSTDIWTADATEFKIKLVDFGPDGAYDGGDDTEHEITISSPAQGEWVSLDIPLSDFTGLTTTSNIAQLIYVGSPSQANTVFVDNVYFHN